MPSKRRVPIRVVESWFRSAAAGVRAETVDAPITLASDALRDHREAHPLARVFPLLDEVLGQAARDCDAVMAVFDAAGQLLWACGSPGVLRRAEAIGFVEGSNWDERLAGTSAPGMALTLDDSAQVVRAEHFRRSVRGWSCAATPIHDPTTHLLLGALDITGGDSIVVPQTTALVRAAARLAEVELAREGLARRGREEQARSTGHLRVLIESLGRSRSLLGIDDGRSGQRTIPLSLRHSEILVLLSSTAQGLSGDELAVLLYPEDGGASTLRAELNRLRHLLGEELLASRPYRLMAELRADWLAVDAHLAAGDVVAALRGYRGPLLSASVAPGVVRLRENLEASLRRAVINSGEPDLMSIWTRSTWGADDYGMWQAQFDALGPTSPLLPLAAGQLARLDRDFGLPSTESGPRRRRL